MSRKTWVPEGLTAEGIASLCDDPDFMNSVRSALKNMRAKCREFYGREATNEEDRRMIAAVVGWYTPGHEGHVH